MNKYKCIVCGYIYDPAAGDPDSGVKPGTPFEKLPADWVCPLCGHEHANTEKTRADWNAGGAFVGAETGATFDKDNPPGEVTFRWHALIDYPWEELVKEWLSAQEAKHVGNYAPLVNFLQKRCAEMASERTIHDIDLPFARIAIENPTAKLWPEEAARFLTADRQSEDQYWVMIRAWAKTGETRRLWYGKLYGSEAIEAKRIEFGVAANCVMVDSGFQPKGDQGVYSACIRYGWFAAKGAEDAFFWHIIQRPPPNLPLRVQKPWAPMSYGDPGEGTSAQGKVRCKLYRFSSPVMKDRVMGLIRAGLWVEPDLGQGDEMDQECARQMSAEFKRPKVNKFTGRMEMVWVCPGGNNHAFDCAAMQILCAMCGYQTLLPAGVELEKENPAKETNEPMS